MLSEQEPDQKMLYEVQAKRALAIEKLFLSLVLMTALPDDNLEQLGEQLEEIVDLKESFKNLKIGEVSKKKAKVDSEDKTQALKVLFDILTAQLMKQQSFMREMANYVFKQFCAELDSESLANLITIVSTPNDKAIGMVNADDSSDSQEGVAYEISDSEDSQDL